MIDSSILATVRSGFAALDLSAENERIVQIGAEIDRNEAAVEVALARIDEISGVLSARQQVIRVGFFPGQGDDLGDAAIADAMVESLDPGLAIAASPTTDQLEQDRATLQGGVRELLKRVVSLRLEYGPVHSAANAKAFTAASPIFDAIVEDAQSAAQRIVDCYASLAAIVGATRARPAIVEGARNAVEALAADHGLWTREPSIAVPAEIVALLEPLADKGPALKPTLIRSTRY